MDKKNLEASSRIALAAFLHDLGKFAERARIPEADVKDEEGNSRADLNKQLYCPHRKEFTDARGYFTHVHAAYTAIAMDLLEDDLPKLKGRDVFPFASWKSKDADDSLINAAAMHHKPESFLQWVIAIADRVASGFERDEFAEYNQAEEKEDHYVSRQLTLMEQIDLQSNKEKTKSDLQYRYPLKALSPEAIFPVEKSKRTRKQAQEEYRALWNQFKRDLEKIPEAHRDNLPLWLDHFETLWGTYTHAIPSATVGNTKAEISLYDHSRTTAALATALWRYHDENNTAATAQLDNEWDEKKFLLIQGDFFGIQSFIFASGGETNKRAAKLLRGRSFYVSLLMECAALRLLDELSLPATSQIINAAGKFMIVAPNTDKTLDVLNKLSNEFNQWFLQKTWGQSGIGLAWQDASCNDFTSGQYKNLIKQLYQKLDVAKYQRLDLCDQDKAVFDDYLDSFDNNLGVCQIDGRSPATENKDGIEIGDLAWDQIKCGEYIVKPDLERLLLTTAELERQKTLRLAVFGYYVNFVKNEDASGKFGEFAKTGKLRRAWDFSLPKKDEGYKALWNGYARRNINAYVPKYDGLTGDEQGYGKYAAYKDDDIRENSIKSFCHLAQEDRTEEKGSWRGTAALMALKGDIDNLGMMFQKGLGKPCFAKTAALSRQINAFFAVYLPWLCQTEQDFHNCYTVFAGGDDFFFIGPWHSQMKLARRVQQDFKRYVAHNKQVHFSAGFVMVKAGVPITYLAENSEKALDKAKAYNPENQAVAPKNVVTCFNEQCTWDEFNDLGEREARLNEFKDDHDLSTGYTYGLLTLADMAGSSRPEDSIWRSYFAYRTRRMLERNKKLNETKRISQQQYLAEEISEKGIERYKKTYKVALFAHLYQNRY